MGFCSHVFFRFCQPYLLLDMEVCLVVLNIVTKKVLKMISLLADPLGITEIFVSPYVFEGHKSHLSWSIAETVLNFCLIQVVAKLIIYLRGVKYHSTFCNATQKGSKSRAIFVCSHPRSYSLYFRMA